MCHKYGKELLSLCLKSFYKSIKKTGQRMLIIDRGSSLRIWGESTIPFITLKKNNKKNKTVETIQNQPNLHFGFFWSFVCLFVLRSVYITGGSTDCFNLSKG